MLEHLANIRVIEMGGFIAGPAATMHLADLGAEVIKVERPGIGDPFRAYRDGLYSPHFQTYNRNKRSVEIDTGQPEGLAALDRLVATADVFIQNFRPGIAEKLHVGHGRLRAHNPRLIYCSISGFGGSGPDRDRPAFDTVAQAASGFLRLQLDPVAPRVMGPAIADAVTGMYAAVGVLAALHRRTATGTGALVETSMLEAMVHFNLDDFTHYLSVGQVMDPFSRPRVSQSYVFVCADGRKLALHLSSPLKFWENLLTVVGDPNLTGDPTFASREDRTDHYEDIAEQLRPRFAAKPLTYWTERLTEVEVPHHEVVEPDAVLASNQARHLGLEVSGPSPLGGNFRTIRNPLSFDGRRATNVTAPPLLGQDNAALLPARPSKD